MPSMGKNKKVLHVNLPIHVSERLKRFADISGMTRTQVVEMGLSIVFSKYEQHFLDQLHPGGNESYPGGNENDKTP